MYKVVIPSAGVGSRIGPYTKFLNKALVTIDNQPAIARIISQFPDAAEIVILLGYRGDYVRQAVKALFPDSPISFVWVDKWEGVGTGLGYTLRCAREHLQCPFIFISNDTVIPDEQCNLDPEVYGNWMGWTQIDGDTSQYRTLGLKCDELHGKSYVTTINAKGVTNDGKAYIGVAGIRDFEEFWKVMEADDAISMGESFGLQALTNRVAFEFPSWCDIGNLESLRATRSRLDTNEYNILEKENEAIWFKDDKVIKFSIDKNFIADRIKRLEFLDASLFPTIQSYDENLYVYTKIEGQVLSESITSPSVRKVLNTISEKVWRPNKMVASQQIIDACYQFYKVKTEERVQLFHTKYEVLDREVFVNGVVVPSAEFLLRNLDWKRICEDPFVTSFHGDFHNENILIDKLGEPILIDWRQNFGGDNLHLGDAYYDFAKFNHGLIVSHSMVHQEHFSVAHLDSNTVSLDIHRPMKLVDAEVEFHAWLSENEISVPRVKVLTALIFLNIAALHEHPYSEFLYYLGRSLLYRYGEDSDYGGW